MPVKPMIQVRSKTYDQFVSDLAAEWSDAKSANAEPVILEEKDREGRLVHVYVVWDAWSQVERTERSEIVMDAAEKVLPQPRVMDITIAMGLTREEAMRMGLKF